MPLSVNTAELVSRVDAWLAEAAAHPQLIEPTAMTLATVDAGGKPHARVVLLKGHDARGFVFYTNAHSHKGEELAANTQAALCLYWMPLKKQLRVEGGVSFVSDEEADAYFHSRPLESQWGAWASLQSQALDSREVLLTRFEEMKAKFGENVPRPPHWRGYRVQPELIEFWSSAPFRLHQRESFHRLREDAWEGTLLYP